MPQRRVWLERKNLPLHAQRGDGFGGRQMEGGHPLPLQDGAKRFGELHTRLHNATEAVLSRCLQQLERDGLVSRQVFGSKPPLKSEYALTDFGRSFLPVLAALTEWGNQVIVARGSFVDEGRG